MIGLYAGLRREEILALQWECVFLDVRTPYISVRRAWRSEHNRPVISTILKTPAAKRDIPIPKCLADCLHEAKANSISEYFQWTGGGGGKVLCPSVNRKFHRQGERYWRYSSNGFVRQRYCSERYHDWITECWLFLWRSPNFEPCQSDDPGQNHYGDSRSIWLR